MIQGIFIVDKCASSKQALTVHTISIEIAIKPCLDLKLAKRHFSLAVTRYQISHINCYDFKDFY